MRMNYLDARNMEASSYLVDSPAVLLIPQKPCRFSLAEYHRLGI
jgi:hypothetical protein